MATKTYGLDTRLCRTYRIAEIRKRASIAELQVPKGSSSLQFTGGELDEVKVEGIVHPEHPLYKSLEELQDDFENERWVAVDDGVKIWPGFQIRAFAWEEVGGLPEERTFSMILVKVS